MVDGCAYCFRHAAARAWGPKLPGLLSVIGSYIIIREITSSHQLGRPSSSIPRLLLSMSIADIFFSAPYIFTTWAAPSHIENLYQASGTIATCTLQGASLQLGVQTSPLFHLALSICSLLIIRYNWSARRIFRLELTMQCVIWIYGLVATVPFIFYKLYNPTSTSCWIASYPHHCGVLDDDEIECIRGDGASVFRAVFAFWPTWPCIILGILNMIAIYWTVRRLETRNKRYAGRSSIYTSGSAVQLQQHANRQRSRAVAIQALCYTAAFLLTFSLDTIVLLWNVVNLTANQALIVAAYVLFPMQGVFNILVYARTSQMCTPEGRLLMRLLCCSTRKGQAKQEQSREEPQVDQEVTSLHQDITESQERADNQIVIEQNAQDVAEDEISDVST